MNLSAPARQAMAFTAIVYTLVIAIALALPHAPATPIISLFTPVTAVVLITLVGTRRGHRRSLWASIGLQRGGFASWPFAVLLPVLFLVIAYGAAVLIGVATFRGPDLSGHGLSRSLPNLIAGLVIGTILILGEEIGWRGYLLPRLQAVLPRRKAAVATGFLHGGFHLPAILLTTTYDSVGSRYVVAPAVVTTITFAGVFYAWLRERSGSLWPVAVAHATANTVFGLGAMAAVTSTPVALAYTAGETGLATLVGVAAVGVWLLARSPAWDRPCMGTA